MQGGREDGAQRNRDNDALADRRLARDRGGAIVLAVRLLVGLLRDQCLHTPAKAGEGLRACLSVKFRISRNQKPAAQDLLLEAPAEVFEEQDGWLWGPEHSLDLAK